MLERPRRLMLFALTAIALGASSLAAQSSDDGLTQEQLPPVQQRHLLPDVFVDYAAQLGIGDRVVQPVAINHTRSVTDTTWIGLGNNSLWTNPSNWSTNLVPDGPSATARFRNISGGPIAQLGGASVELGVLEMSDPLLSAVLGGTITLSGFATVHANGVNFDLPGAAIQFQPADLSFGGASNNVGGIGTLATTIVGTNGLNKTGDSHIQIESNQSYLGTTTISGGGKIITTVGDAAFGNSANDIALNNGSILIDQANWITSRTINVLDGGGNIHWIGINRQIQMNGVFTGIGSLQLSGAFGPTGVSTLTANHSAFTGTLTLSIGTVALTQSGAFPAAAAIRNAGTLVLNNSGSGSSVNRLGDSIPVLMRGAALTARGGSGAAYNETVGPLTLDGGANFITAQAGSGGSVQLTLGALNRSNGAGVIFRGTNLGAAPGPGATNIFITGGTTLVKGLIPFAWGNGTFSNFTPVESPDNLLMTYGANGVTPITTYASNFSGSTVDTNVRLTSNASVAGTVNSNALVLAAPADLEVSNGAAAITLSGGTLHVDSGAVLSANAGYNSLDLGTINAFPGNAITAALDFGTREAVFMTPSALSVSGVISGSGGLTKVGGRTGQFSGANTYTGVTTLNGLNRFVGNVLADGTTAGPFGKSTTPIVLYGGNVSPLNPIGDFSGSGSAQLGGNTSTSTTFSRDLDVRGDWVQLRNFGTGTLVWAGSIVTSDPQTILTFVAASSGPSGRMVVNGVISGPARIENHALTATDLMNANTFTGGFDLDGTVGVGNDQALSTGSVIFHSDTGGTLSSAGGPRTLANKFVILAGTAGLFTIGGSDPVTLSGEVNGRGGDYLLNVTNSATTTFSGSLTGGAFRKTGNGTLVLSGNNTFDSNMSVGSGSTSGGMVIIRSNSAAGSTIGNTVVQAGSNALALDGANALGGAVTIGEEVLLLAGDGVANLGALRNLTGNNVWGGFVRPIPSYDGTTVTSQRTSIGVDSGTLLIDSALISNDPGTFDSGNATFLANSIGVRKLGPGALVVGSDVINSTVGTSSFDWNGAIVCTGSLDVQAGSVIIKASAGIGTIANGKSVCDVGSLNIAGGSGNPSAKLDLTNNGLLIDYTGSSPLADIRAYILKGRNGGNWLGNGITTSMASASPNPGEVGKTAIGYGEASSLGLTRFMSDPVDSTTVLVRYTYIGDADLDGDVDGVDIGKWATSFTGELGGTGSKIWTDGDWDYDGDVDGIDAGLWAVNFTGELGGLGLGDIGINSPINPQAAAILQAMGIIASVPEPALASVLLLGMGCLLRRRRSQCKS